MTQPQSQSPPEPPGDSVRGFLPDHEGQQLYEWAQQAAPIGPLLEIGSYCGKSTIWLGQAAKAHGTVGVKPTVQKCIFKLVEIVSM